MSENFEPEPDQVFLDTMGMIRGAIGSMQSGVLGLDRWEYCLVPMEELSDYGRDRWRLVPVQPLMEVKIVLGQAQEQRPMFVMERQVLVDDQAIADMQGPPRA